MPRGSWAEAIYPAAELFIERSLRSNASFVTGAPSVWTTESADEFYDRFVVKEDLGSESFNKKLSGQLAGASQNTILLAADLVCLCTLPVRDMRPDRKLNRLRAATALLSPEPEVDERILDAFQTGLASYGVGKTSVWKHMRWLAEFARAWMAFDDGRRARGLGDPWAWKELLADVPGGIGAPASAMLHMVFPDVFEPIVSVDMKAAIGETFARTPGVADEPDVDRKLVLVRSALEPVLGAKFRMWDDSVQPVWGASSDPSWTFAEFALEFRKLTNFEKDEIEYKLELAGRLAAARQAVLSNEADWLSLLKRAFASPNNITNWRHHDSFLKWCEARPDEATTALASLWSAESAQAADVDSFLAAILNEASGSPGDRANIISYLLGAWDPQDWVTYKATRSDRALRLCGLDPAETRDVADRIARFAAFIDQLRVRVIALGGPPTTRLDAQGMAWFVVSDFVPEGWAQEQKDKLAAFRARTNGGTGGNGHGHRGATLSPITQAFADSLFLPRTWLADITSLVAEKRQAIFFGPPGTGKTWVAQKLAEFLVSSPEHYELVQFHPSYTYEDFVQGYRPTTSDGLLSYELRDGALLRIADRARNDSDSPHVLIIDEINRGNIAKIFGELLHLLEYRDRSITLQYSGEFTLPDNLYVLGTMNTADRSIALVDTALRRRFYFIEFSPTSGELKGVLRRWLEANKLSTEPADLLDALNAKLEALEGGHDFTIGPSYFMVDGGPDLDHVWRHAIRPVLVERFYGRKTPSEIDAEFGFTALESDLGLIEAEEPSSTPDEELHDAAM